MHGEPAVPIDALLAQRGWVRALARTLVADGAAADDLEQQAWVEALERPPARGGSLRAWFATVLRRRARDGWRERERRGRREEAAARPESGRSTAEVVAEADAHRRVVDAVMALEEPYRETILLRFFEDLPPREVAARQGIPAETVRTRTRRALERLRARLDAGSGGDRSAWAAALVPITGGTIMASKAAVAAVAAAAVLGGVAGGLSMRAAGTGEDLASARAEIRSLCGRLDEIEARPGGGGVAAVLEERMAALDRRQAVVEEAVAASARVSVAPAPSAGDQEKSGQAAEAGRKALDEALKARPAAEGALKERREAEAVEKETIEQLRRRAEDRSLADQERTTALTKLRFMKGGINRDVVVAMVEFFRSCKTPGFRAVVLRDLHGTKDPDLKQVFLDALRDDPAEWVRERAAQDIDDYLDDPAVVLALESARDGDSSEKVRKAAGSTLESKGKERK